MITINNTHYIFEPNIQENKITSVRKVENKEEFIKVYLQDLSSFLRIDNATQIKLLALIWRDIDSDSNTLIIIRDIKEKWANEIGCSIRTIDNCLSTLVRKELLFTQSRSIYSLNSNYFVKENLISKSNKLNLQLNYEISNLE